MSAANDDVRVFMIWEEHTIEGNYREDMIDSKRCYLSREDAQAACDERNRELAEHAWARFSARAKADRSALLRDAKEHNALVAAGLRKGHVTEPRAKKSATTSRTTFIDRWMRGDRQYQFEVLEGRRYVEEMDVR